MPKSIFCINCGSSSIKFALYKSGSYEELVAQGAAERIGLPDGELWLNGINGDGSNKCKWGRFYLSPGSVPGQGEFQGQYI